MRICHVDPACGLSIPPKNWGAIEKIIWEFEQNQIALGHESTHRLEGHILPGEFDIVHCHVANLANSLASRGIPYIYQLHDHHVVHWGKDSHVYKENLKAIENSVVALVPARYLKEWFDNHPKIQYFAHGVDSSTLYPKENYSTPPLEHKLLMLANNGLGGHNGYDRKGFTFGIQTAMARNLPITIVGPKNNENYFRENPWAFGYPKLDIIWEPSNDELLDIYHDHTIFLHPSELEAGHPNLTLLEAAACGLPLLGWIEMETTFHGLWRAPRNVPALVEGLDTIIKEYEWYSTNARKTAEELNWRNRTIELMQIYESVL